MTRSYDTLSALDLQPRPLGVGWKTTRGPVDAAAAPPGALIRTEVEDGLVLWTTVAVAAESTRGSLAGELYTLDVPDWVVDQVKDAATGWTVARMTAYLQHLERTRFMPTPGLRRWKDGDFVADGEIPAGRLALLLIHGTFSNPMGAFGSLVGSAGFPDLAARYPGGVWALAHHTVTVSPMENVTLALHGLHGRLVDIVTHSRGGLVADLLCLRGAPRAADLRAAYGADHLSAGVDTEWEALRAAWAAGLGPTVRRLVRVACPAAGTPLIGNGTVLHSGLSLLTWLAQKKVTAVAPWAAIPAAFARSVMLAIVASTEDPGQVAGLASMDMDGGLARLLPRAGLDDRTDLLDIQGRYGQGWQLPLRWLSEGLFGFRRNDLVVPTTSMVQGLQRMRRSAHLETGVDHVHYFDRDEVRARIADHLRLGAPSQRSTRGAAEARNGVVALVPAALGSRRMAGGWESDDGVLELLGVYGELGRALEAAGYDVRPLPWSPGEGIAAERFAGVDVVVAHLEGRSRVPTSLHARMVVAGGSQSKDGSETRDRVYAKGPEQTFDGGVTLAGAGTWATASGPGDMVADPAVVTAVVALVGMALGKVGAEPRLPRGAPPIFRLKAPEPVPQSALAAWGAAYGVEVDSHPVHVRVLWGSPAHVDASLVAFRFEGEPLTGGLAARHARQPALQLEHRVAAGLVGGGRGDLTVIAHDLAVVGLGPPGALRPLDLEEAVAHGVAKLLLEGHTRLAFELPALRGLDELGPDAVLGALVRGAVRGEASLDENGLSHAPLLALDLVEPYRDLATEALITLRRFAAHGLRRLLEVAPNLTRIPGFRSDHPVATDGTPWLTLSMKAAPGPERAWILVRRSGASERTGGRGGPDAEIRRLAGVATSDRRVHIATAELLPRDWRDVLDHPLLVTLDRAASGIPVERLAVADGVPVALRHGLLRSLQVEARPEPIQSGRRALVIGNPAGAGLPRAAAEAEAVTTIFKQFGYEVECLIGESGRRNRDALLSEGWRVIHLATHGLPDGSIDLGGGACLRAPEVQHLQGIPACVFLNCCWSGGMETATSFAWELVKAGVRAFVGTGWPVDDAIALRFAERFYTELLAGRRLGVASLLARRAAASQDHDPSASWAAWQVYGAPGFHLHPGGAAPHLDLASLVSDQQALDAVVTAVGLGRDGSDVQRMRRWIRDLGEWFDARLARKPAPLAELRFRMAAGWMDACYPDGPHAVEPLAAPRDPQQDLPAGAREVLEQAHAYLAANDDDEDTTVRARALRLELELALGVAGAAERARDVARTFATSKNARILGAYADPDTADRMAKDLPVEASIVRAWKRSPETVALDDFADSDRRKLADRDRRKLAAWRGEDEGLGPPGGLERFRLDQFQRHFLRPLAETAAMPPEATSTLIREVQEALIPGLKVEPAS